MALNTKSKRIELMGFLPPDQRDIEALKDYKDCGFTLGFMTEDYVKVNDPEYFKCLDNFEKLGLDACIVFYRNKNPQYVENFRNVDLTKYPALKLIYLTDEPTDEMIEGVRDVYAPWFNENYSNSNICPIMCTYGGGADHGNYEQHIENCLKDIMQKVNAKEKIFLIDNYPLRFHEGWQRYMSGRSYLKGLSVSAKKAVDSGCRFGACIQTFDGWSNVRFPDDKNDLRFEFYTNLAFGASAFDYFLYMSTEATDYVFRGMVTTKGIKRPVYYDVQAVNKEIKNFEEEYMSFDWVGTSFFEGENWKGEKSPDFEYARESLNYTDDNIAKVEVERDTLIGCFKRKDGKKGYVFVNFNEPSEEKTNKVTVTFKKGKKLTTYIHGEKEVTELKDGKFTINMERGGGFFSVLDVE